MYYEETTRISLFFKIAIAIVLIIGIIGGICLGCVFDKPSKEALRAIEALEEAERNPYKYDTLERIRFEEKLNDTSWTSASIGAMLGMWGISAISALLLYAKKCQIEMMDDMVGILKNIESPEKMEEEKEE